MSIWFALVIGAVAMQATDTSAGNRGGSSGQHRVAHVEAKREGGRERKLAGDQAAGRTLEVARRARGGIPPAGSGAIGRWRGGRHRFFAGARPCSFCWPPPRNPPRPCFTAEPGSFATACGSVATFDT